MQSITSELDYNPGDFLLTDKLRKDSLTHLYYHIASKWSIIWAFVRVAVPYTGTLITEYKVAVIVGVSQNGVHQRKVRGLEMLRRMLTR